MLLPGCLQALCFCFFLNVNPNGNIILEHSIVELGTGPLLWEPYFLSLRVLNL